VSGSNVYVVWTSNVQENSNDQEKNGQIFFTRSTDNGDNFTDPVELSEAKKDEIGTKVFRPQLIVDSKNNVHVVWYSGRNVQHADVKALITDIQYIKSTNGGESFGRILNLSNYSGWSINPQIASSQNNNVYVVWTNNAQEKYGKIFFARSTDNGDNFEEIKNIDNETGTSGYPQIAVSGSNVYLVWHDAKHGILFAKSTDNGDNFESLSLSNNYFGKSLYPQIAVSQNNNTYVAWANNATGNEEIIFKKDTKNNNCANLNVGNRTKNLYNDTTTDDLKSKSINIALVDATFTASAYDKSFYMFYEIYHDADGLANITKYTDLLHSKVVHRDKMSSEYQDLVNHLKWLSPNSTVNVLTDEDVHNTSSIFANKKTNIYDVIILGHQEYMTQQEYDNLKRFVANGGTLILLNGNVFYNEVNYDEDSKMLTFVKGHGYAYDGKSAEKSTNDTWDEAWKNETRRWVGSNYLCCYDSNITFRNDPFGITHNEEQHITNRNAKILIDYNATKNQKEASIATYLLEYKKGKVIGLGIWTDDKLLKSERFFRLLDSLFFQYVFNESS
jgi:N,N-dimethylformamidase beta subunit-like, C-terminal